MSTIVDIRDLKVNQPIPTHEFSQFELQKFGEQ